MENKQTAVQWLERQYKLTSGDLFKADFEQALQMEREQIVDAFDDGQANHCLPRDYESGKQYYTQTFNQ